MKLLSALAGFSCQTCGHALPYFETSHTIRRMSSDGPFSSATCRSCGSQFRIAMGQGWVGRAVARLRYLLPLVLVLLIALRMLGVLAGDTVSMGMILIWGVATLALLQLTSAIAFRFLFRLEAV